MVNDVIPSRRSADQGCGRVHRRVPARDRRQGTGRRPCALSRRPRTRRPRQLAGSRTAWRSSPTRPGSSSRDESATCAIADAGARVFSRFLFSGAFEFELDAPGPRGPPHQPARVRRSEVGGRGDWSARITSSCGSPAGGTPYSAEMSSDEFAERITNLGHLANQMSHQGPSGPQPTAVEMEEGHLPVMVEEVLESLAPAPGSFQIDATVGGGGHSRRILEAASPDGRLLGLDADQAAIARTSRRLAEFGDRVTLTPGELRGARRRGGRQRASFRPTGCCSTSA